MQKITIMKQTIKLTGRIDTASVATVDGYIADELKKMESVPELLTIDFTDVEYISSSGLRIMLKYRKQCADMQIVNVKSDVYNVFEMTGFTRMMKVVKALRKIDLSKCTRLAHGANGEVYKINDEEIVKLSLFKHREEELIEEMNNVREAFILGVPTMMSFDTVEVNDGRRGIVMEALRPTTLAQHLQEHPDDLDNCIEPYIDLFRKTNVISVEPGRFGNAKQKLLDDLLSPMNFLGDELTAGVKELVDALPEGNCLVHGDGHPSNALLCGEDDSRSMMLIDMGDLSIGHRIFEIMGWAFLMNGTDYSPACRIGPKSIGLDYPFLQRMFRKMLASYLDITDTAAIDRAVKAASYVGVLRLICCSQVRDVTPERQKPIIALAQGAVEHREETLESISFLSN